MIDIAILDRLNAPAAEERLENLRALLPGAAEDILPGGHGRWLPSETGTSPGCGRCGWLWSGRRGGAGAA